MSFTKNPFVPQRSLCVGPVEFSKWNTSAECSRMLQPASISTELLEIRVSAEYRRESCKMGFALSIEIHSKIGNIIYTLFAWKQSVSKQTI